MNPKFGLDIHIIPIPIFVVALKIYNTNVSKHAILLLILKNAQIKSESLKSIV